MPKKVPVQNIMTSRVYAWASMIIILILTLTFMVLFSVHLMELAPTGCRPLLAFTKVSYWNPMVTSGKLWETVEAQWVFRHPIGWLISMDIHEIPYDNPMRFLMTTPWDSLWQPHEIPYDNPMLSHALLDYCDMLLCHVRVLTSDFVELLSQGCTYHILLRTPVSLDWRSDFRWRWRWSLAWSWSLVCCLVDFWRNQTLRTASHHRRLDLSMKQRVHLLRQS